MNSDSDLMPIATPADAFHLLDAAGMGYQVRRTALGEQFAVFRWRTQGLVALSCSLIVHDEAWRLTAHQHIDAALPTVSDHELAQRNLALPLVRAYRDPRDGSLACALALRVRQVRLSPNDLIDVLVHLAESVEFATGMSTRSPILPILSSADPSEHTAASKREADLMLSVPAPGWVEVDALDSHRLWDVLADNAALLRRLHDWAPVGKLVDAHGLVCARITALGAGITGPDADSAIDDARFLLAAVARFA